MTYKVLVTGSRRWTDVAAVTSALSGLFEVHGRGMLIVHGDCPTGADMIAHRYAADYGIPCKPQPADWDACGPECPPREHRKPRLPWDVHHPGVLADYCPYAGPRRNRAMVAAGADMALVFAMSRSWGTENCFKLIKAAGIPWTRLTA